MRGEQCAATSLNRPACPPGAARRASECFPERSRELTGRGEACCQCHFQNRPGSLPQQLSRASQSQGEIVFVDSAPELATEQPLELAQRHTCSLRKSLARQRRF